MGYGWNCEIITFTDVSVDDNANTAKKYKISNDNTTAVKLFDVTTEYNDAIINEANFSSSNLLSKDVIPNDTVLDKGKIIAISENTNTSNVSKFTIVELSSININGTTRWEKRSTKYATTRSSRQ